MTAGKLVHRFPSFTSDSDAIEAAQTLAAGSLPGSHHVRPLSHFDMKARTSA